MITVSLVKETRTNERRVLLLPNQVSKISEICDFQVESGAGLELGIGDMEYEKAGARIVDRFTAWQNTSFVLKLKRPSLEEVELLPAGIKIAALLHAETIHEIVDVFLDKKITSYSFEYFQDENGVFPLMKATGEISGKMAVIYGAYHLQSQLGGSGKLFPICQAEKGATVAVLGFGNVGRSATELILAFGCLPVVFRWSLTKATVENFNGHQLTFLPWDVNLMREIIPNCDLIIGAIRISTFDTPIFLDKAMIQSMKPGSLIIDVTAGYGAGYIETSTQTTSLTDPYFISEGIEHIKIREFPLGVHKTSATQISEIYGPHINKLIESISNKTIYNTAERGVITADGVILNEQILKHYSIKYKE